VNPTQFAPGEDFDMYPRTFEQDYQKLANEQKVDAVFFPTENQLHPNQSQRTNKGTIVRVEGLSHILEGSIRPHFFQGVATVVTKLLLVVQPTKAFFGQKDGQQCVIVKTLVRDLFIPTEIVICPTVREKDGLAMSSRNVYLSPEERHIAPGLFRILSSTRTLFERGEQNCGKLIEYATAGLEKEGFTVQYINICNLETLEELQIVNIPAMLSVAVLLGKVRLIDNVILKC
jgi:pantoate--beta-alanine ligase